jgi:UDP-2,4-diacetamido-2,4,6-trideoxy-beta-L-altropyranose hydrolase
MPRIVFRADAGLAIGAGHAMRCLALASHFIEGGWLVGFAASAETFTSVEALGSAPVERLEFKGAMQEEPKTLAQRWPKVDVLVVDHYGRDAAFERACRAFAKRIVVIDDLADRKHDADVLVDGAAGSVAAYGDLVPASCRILAGPAYAVVHPEFRRSRERALAHCVGKAVERVLISFGQIDPKNATLQALAALEVAGFKGKVDVVLGRAAPHLDEVRAKAGGRVRLHVDAPNMAALMSEADLAVGAGGTTAWERCCLGLPSIIVTLADNQRHIVSAVSKAGAASDAGPLDGGLDRRIADALSDLAADGARRARMAKAGAALVDGRGSERVVLAAIGPVVTKEGRTVTLRLAELGDEAWLLALQVKPETRQFANDSAIPTASEHARWLRCTLDDPTRLLAILESDCQPAGMLRLDRAAKVHRVSIAIDPAHHRSGIGSAGLEWAARIAPGHALEAQVLPSNKASLALFQAAGYRHVAEDLYRREPA